MKRYLAVLCILLVALTFAGCGEQSFDDVSYNTAPIDATTAVQNYITGTTQMQSLTAAEYDTTIITTSADTPISATQTLVTLIGKLNAQPYVQIKLINHDKTYVATTWYKGIIYTDNNGVVTSQSNPNPSADSTLILQNFSALMPAFTLAGTITQFVESAYTKTFNGSAYFKLNMSISPSSLSYFDTLIGNPLAPYQSNGFKKPVSPSAISNFYYEFGLNSRTGYVQAFRTYYETQTVIGGVSTTVSTSKTTTVLKAYGSNNVILSVPQVKED